MSSAYFKNLKFLFVFYGFINAPTDTTAAISYISGPVCFGTHESPAVITTSCHQGVITITKVIHGAKHLSADCPDVFEDGVHDIRCCVQSDEDCVFDHDFSLVQMFQGQCNGRSRCTIQTDRVQLTEDHCMDKRDFPNTTNYIYVEFNCIKGSNVGHNCLIDKASDEGELFLVGSDLEGEMTDRAGTGCSCSVESDRCDTTLDVITVRRRIAMDGETTDCQTESLVSIYGPESNQNVIWTCHDVMTATTSSNYVKMHIDDVITGSGNGSDFWVGFKVSSPARLSLACPARKQRFCTETPTTVSSVTNNRNQELHEKKFLLAIVVGIVVTIALVLVIVFLICRNLNRPERPLPQTNGNVQNSTPISPGSPPPIYRGHADNGTVSSSSNDSGFVLVTYRSDRTREQVPSVDSGILRQSVSIRIDQDYSQGRIPYFPPAQRDE